MARKLALDGLKVFELGSSVAGPYGAWILAQFGAEVIKVERPVTGDDARHWGPPFWHGSAAYFQALNRDKHGITVDFKNPKEVERLRRLIIDLMVSSYKISVPDSSPNWAFLRQISAARTTK